MNTDLAAPLRARAMPAIQAYKQKAGHDLRQTAPVVGPDAVTIRRGYKPPSHGMNRNACAGGALASRRSTLHLRQRPNATVQLKPRDFLGIGRRARPDGSKDARIATHFYAKAGDRVMAEIEEIPQNDAAHSVGGNTFIAVPLIGDAPG